MFKQFLGNCWKPLKRLGHPFTALHRAKALVLMRTDLELCGALRLGALLLLLMVGRALAATRYVDVNSTNATPPLHQLAHRRHEYTQRTPISLQGPHARDFAAALLSRPIAVIPNFEKGPNDYLYELRNHYYETAL